MAIIKYPYRDKHGSFKLVFEKDGKQYRVYKDGHREEASRFLPPERFRWLKVWKWWE